MNGTVLVLLIVLLVLLFGGGGLHYREAAGPWAFSPLGLFLLLILVLALTGRIRF